MFAVLYSPVSRIFPWPSSLCRRFLCRVSPGTRTCASGCVCGDASSRLASSPAPDTQLRRHPRCVPPAKLFRHTVESSSREDEKQRARNHPSWPSFTSLFPFFLSFFLMKIFPYSVSPVCSCVHLHSFSCQTGFDSGGRFALPNNKAKEGVSRKITEKIERDQRLLLSLL